MNENAFWNYLHSRTKCGGCGQRRTSVSSRFWSCHPFWSGSLGKSFPRWISESTCQCCGLLTQCEPAGQSRPSSLEGSESAAGTGGEGENRSREWTVWSGLLFFVLSTSIVQTYFICGQTWKCINQRTCWESEEGLVKIPDNWEQSLWLKRSFFFSTMALNWQDSKSKQHNPVKSFPLLVCLLLWLHRFSFLFHITLTLWMELFNSFFVCELWSLGSMEKSKLNRFQLQAILFAVFLQADNNLYI